MTVYDIILYSICIVLKEIALGNRLYKVVMMKIIFVLDFFIGDEAVEKPQYSTKVCIFLFEHIIALFFYHPC